MRKPVFALFMACASAWAGPLPGDSPDLLAGIASQLSEPGVVRAGFVQEKQLAVLSKPIVSRGRLVVSRGEGLIWKIEAPLQMSIAVNGSGVIEADAAGRRRVGTGDDNPVQAEVGRVFRGLLVPDMGILERYFKLQAEGTLRDWRIALTPRSAQLGNFIRALQITGGPHIETIRIEESNNDTTLIRLHDVTVADNLSADERALLGTP